MRTACEWGRGMARPTTKTRSCNAANATFGAAGKAMGDFRRPAKISECSNANIQTSYTAKLKKRVYPPDIRMHIYKYMYVYIAVSDEEPTKNSQKM